jgi:hypothetical protein
MANLFRIFILVVLFIPGFCFGIANNMNLQGQGEIRYLGFIKVCDAFLYTEKDSTVENILAPENSRCLRLNYAVPVSADDLIKGANAVLVRQYKPERLRLEQANIDTLHRGYRDIVKGNNYTLCYSAENKKTTLSLNGQELVSIVSADFASMYFGIWFGPKAPLDEELRDRLLPRAFIARH